MTICTDLTCTAPPTLPTLDEEGFHTNDFTAKYDTAGKAHLLNSEEMSDVQRRDPSAAHGILNTQIKGLSAYGNGNAKEQVSLEVAARTLVGMDDDALAELMSRPLEPTKAMPDRQTKLAQAVFNEMVKAEGSPARAAIRMDRLMANPPRPSDGSRTTAWVGTLPKEQQTFIEIAKEVRESASASRDESVFGVSGSHKFDAQKGAAYLVPGTKIPLPREVLQRLKESIPDPLNNGGAGGIGSAIEKFRQAIEGPSSDKGLPCDPGIED